MAHTTVTRPEDYPIISSLHRYSLADLRHSSQFFFRLYNAEKSYNIVDTSYRKGLSTYGIVSTNQIRQ